MIKAMTFAQTALLYSGLLAMGMVGYTLGRANLPHVEATAPPIALPVTRLELDLQISARDLNAATWHFKPKISVKKLYAFSYDLDAEAAKQAATEAFKIATSTHPHDFIQRHPDLLEAEIAKNLNEQIGFYGWSARVTL